MYKCKKCDYETDNKSKIANHYQYNHKEIKTVFCQKCGKVFKNEKGLKCHTKKSCDDFKNKIEHICYKCGFYIKNSIEKHIKSCNGNGPKRLIKRRSGGHRWAFGKTYDELYGIEKSKDIKERISKKLVGKSQGKSNDPEKEKLRRNKIRIKILEKYSNGWEVKCGRCKKLDYHSEIAGDVKLDGGWELATAKYLDSLNIKWIRNKQRFKYWNSIKNCESTYCPDFFVEVWNKFIEVKGYKTDLDEIKWKQFKDDLEIWDRKKLKELGIKAKWL